MHGGTESVKHEAVTEAIKSVPAVSGAVVSAVTLNEALGIVTIGYILLQAAYLVWKWRRESRG